MSYLKVSIHTLIAIASLNIYSVKAQQPLPFVNIIQYPNFGALMGLPGSCSLNYLTNEVTDVGGSLCPFSDQRYGEAGKYIITATANTNVKIKISVRSPEGDDIRFSPAGIFRVSGQSDINIIAGQEQTIFSGNNGVITIIMGGILTVSTTLPYNSSYEIELANGINISEEP